MYSAQALVDGLYTYQDLPDAIDVASVVFTKLDPPESVAGFTRYYVNANDEYLGILDGEEESLWSYEGGGGACLISGEREDQFADTYTITGGQLGPIQVTRVSLCLWTGLDSCGNEGYLSYTENEESGKLWFADVPNYYDPESCQTFDVLQGDKIGPQNSPVGDYGTHEGFVSLTVS